MKNIRTIALLCVAIFSLVSFTNPVESTKYKCMIQMTNYTGEGAYIVVSLLNPEGDYVETLNVIGDDDEWYNTIESCGIFTAKDVTILMPLQEPQ